jgi:hypothetical protein
MFQRSILMTAPKPASAGVVRFPIDPLTETLLSAAVDDQMAVGEGLANARTSLEDPFFLGAAARCRAVERKGAKIIVDLVDGAARLRDSTPGHSLDVLDYKGRPLLWPEPQIETVRMTPFRIPPTGSEEGWKVHAVEWLRQLDPIDLDRVALAKEAWRSRVDVLDGLAQDRVAKVLPFADRRARSTLDGALRSIRVRKVEQPDPEFDMDFDDYGQAYVPSRTQFINEAISQIWDIAEELEEQEQDGTRRASVNSAVADLVREHYGRLSSRMHAIVEAGMLDQSLGAARGELLELLRPGWSWATSDLKDAVNPPEDAVLAVLAARENDPRVELEFRPSRNGGGTYVLTGEFLGRKVMADPKEVARPS